MNEHDRRTFLLSALGSAAALTFTPGMAMGRWKPKDPYHGFPAQDEASVKEVVGASHSDIDKVRELVSARPALARASWDWGFGDWESALGAASHMGRADIAELLISYGARPNIFTHAMLGNLDAVKSAIEAIPGSQAILGPHGITLMSHVEMRLRRNDLTDSQRTSCENVKEYLLDLGGADTGQTAQEMTETERDVYLGEYAFGEDSEARFVVELNRRGLLSMRRGTDFGRVLNKVETHGFEPSGGPGVRIRFTVSGSKAMAVSIHDPGPVLTASRL